MTRDAFRRFFLVAGCCGLVLALALVATFVSVWVAMVAAFVGPLLALVLTVEATPAARRPASSATATEPRGLSRREIVERARSAGGE